MVSNHKKTKCLGGLYSLMLPTSKPSLVELKLFRKILTQIKSYFFDYTHKRICALVIRFLKIYYTRLVWVSYRPMPRFVMYLCF